MLWLGRWCVARVVWVYVGLSHRLLLQSFWYFLTWLVGWCGLVVVCGFLSVVMSGWSFCVTYVLIRFSGGCFGLGLGWLSLYGCYTVGVCSFWLCLKLRVIFLLRWWCVWCLFWCSGGFHSMWGYLFIVIICLFCYYSGLVIFMCYSFLERWSGQWIRLWIVVSYWVLGIGREVWPDFLVCFVGDWFSFVVLSSERVSFYLHCDFEHCLVWLGRGVVLWWEGEHVFWFHVGCFSIWWLYFLY